MILDLLLSTKMRKKKFTVKEATRILPPRALFGRIPIEDDIRRIVESTNIHYKLKVLMKKRINKRVDAGMPGRI